MSEDRLAMWTAAVLSASFLFPLIGLLVVFGTAAFAQESLMVSSVIWKGVGLLVGYIISAFALLTLKNKGRTRRILSWVYTVAFHALVVLNLAVSTGFHGGILVLLCPEILVVILSIIGTLAAIGSPKHAHAVG